MSTTKRPSTEVSSLDPTLEDDLLAQDPELRKKSTMVDDEVSVNAQKQPVATTANSPPSSVKSALEDGSLHDALDDEAWATCPHNPLTWSFKKKWTMASIVSLYTFVSSVYLLSLIIFTENNMC